MLALIVLLAHVRPGNPDFIIFFSAFVFNNDDTPQIFKDIFNNSL